MKKNKKILQRYKFKYSLDFYKKNNHFPNIMLQLLSCYLLITNGK